MSTDAFGANDLPEPRGVPRRFSLVDGMRHLASSLVERAGLAGTAGLTFGGKRDLFNVLGYKRDLLVQDYRDRFARGDIAARIVEAYPKATWRGGAEIVEDEDPDVSTEFEEQWESLEERLGVWALLSRTDVLAGLGHYAVLLVGAPGKLETPLPSIASVDDIAYLAPYCEDEAEVDQVDLDSTSVRFGLPVTYTISRKAKIGKNSKVFTAKVHYTRLLHIADGLLDDRVYGTPRLEKVWNRLDDLDKVVGGGSEAFWTRVHQGMIFNIDPNVKIDQPQIDKLKEEAEEFAHQMRRTLAARGFSVDTTKSDVANFKAQLEAIISVISGATGIPQRILLGSERGELASTQDKENWDERVSDRRREYAEPIVRALIKILQDTGALAETPDGYEIRWPELKALTEDQQATVADKWSKLNKQAGGLVVLPEEIRDRVLGLEALDPEQIAEFDAQQTATVVDEDGNELDENGDPKLDPQGNPIKAKKPGMPPKGPAADDEEDDDEEDDDDDEEDEDA